MLCHCMDSKLTSVSTQSYLCSLFTESSFVHNSATFDNKKVLPFSLSSLSSPPVVQPSDPLKTERSSLEQLGKTRLKSVRVQRCGVRPTVKTAVQSFDDSSDDLCKV